MFLHYQSTGTVCASERKVKTIPRFLQNPWNLPIHAFENTALSFFHFCFKPSSKNSRIFARRVLDTLDTLLLFVADRQTGTKTFFYSVLEAKQAKRVNPGLRYHGLLLDAVKPTQIFTGNFRQDGFCVKLALWTPFFYGCAVCKFVLQVIWDPCMTLWGIVHSWNGSWVFPSIQSRGPCHKDLANMESE